MAATGPQEFGKYVLLSKLAAGGMAVTFRARMTGAAGVTKPCVIKQILPHFADDQDFIESVDKNWGGELPFTVLYGKDGKKAKVLSGKQSYADFESAVKTALQ